MMYYLRIFLYLVLAMIVATVVIWAGIFLIIFTAIAAPIAAWWIRRNNAKSFKVSKPKNNEKKQTSHKIIEVEYKIIDKE